MNKFNLFRWYHLLFKALLITGIFLLSACESVFEEPFETFIIPSGKHSSNKLTIQSLQTTRLRFEALFDSTAIYETQIPENQYDINKLMGFSECNDQHHTNSARFGWRWLEGALEIHTYVYNEGVRTSELIGVVQLEQSYTYILEFREADYVFTVDDMDPVVVPRTSTCDRGVYYMLFPYFGGDEVAPHDIRIKVKFIY